MIVLLCFSFICTVIFEGFKQFFSDKISCLPFDSYQFDTKLNVQDGMMGGEASPSQVIVCDLLASVVHGLTVGSTADDISLCFARFYSDTEINNARDKATAAGISLPRRSSRKDTDAKQKIIADLVQSVINLDFKSAKVTFAACDLTRVCYVPNNIDDEIQLRTELTTLKKKYDDLEKILKDLMETFQNFSSSTSAATAEIGKMVENISTNIPKLVNVKSASAQPILPGNQPKPWSDQRVTRQIISHKKIPSVDARFKNILLSPSDPRSRQGLFNAQTPTGVQTETENWEIAKPRRSRRKLVEGAATTSSIKAVKPVKITSVFLTRCDPETTVENVKSYLQDSNTWQVNDVVKLNTQNTSYSSFRVDIILGDDDDSEDIIEGKYWPAGTSVRKFHRFNRNGPYRRPIQRTQAND